MIVFPNAKINLGLSVTEKRPDGFHNIETVFYPVGWKDCLEVVGSSDSDSNRNGVGGGNAESGLFTFSSSGLSIDGKPEDNLLYKAWDLIRKDYPVPPIKVHLHKIIPMGAGLGGGSSDAAFFIRMLNDLFELGISWGEMHHYARQLGADCSFFITNRPAFAEGKGDQFESISLDLSSYELLIVYPSIHSNTKEAYQGIVPAKPSISVEDVVTKHSILEWRELLKNDFEPSIFKKYPRIEEIKNMLYAEGAVYASMSGSGSAVYGLFKNLPELKLNPQETLWTSQSQ